MHGDSMPLWFKILFPVFSRFIESSAMFCRRGHRRNTGIHYFLFLVVCMDRGMWRLKACLSFHTNHFFVPICISAAVFFQAYLLSCRFNAAPTTCIQAIVDQWKKCTVFLLASLLNPSPTAEVWCNQVGVVVADCCTCLNIVEFPGNLSLEMVFARIVLECEAHDAVM